MVEMDSLLTLSGTDRRTLAASSKTALDHHVNAVGSGTIIGFSRYGHPAGPVYLPTDRGTQTASFDTFHKVQFANRTLRPLRFGRSSEQVLSNMGQIPQALGSTRKRRARPIRTETGTYLCVHTCRSSVRPLGKQRRPTAWNKARPGRHHCRARILIIDMPLVSLRPKNPSQSLFARQA